MSSPPFDFGGLVVPLPFVIVLVFLFDRDLVLLSGVFLPFPFAVIFVLPALDVLVGLRIAVLAIVFLFVAHASFVLLIWRSGFAPTLFTLAIVAVGGAALVSLLLELLLE